MGRSRCSRVRQPPEGPPICTALKPSRVDLAPAVGDAAADVEDDVAQRGAERHFDQAGVGHVAGQGEGLGAGRRGGAQLAETRRPLR